jgi:hypothetical protein
MRIYGSETLPVKHRTDIITPDVADIHNYGLKSAAGSLRGKGGDFHGYIRNKDIKARSRRILKRAARNAAKNAINKEC